MNPFTGTLNRLGYLVWTLIPWAILISAGILIDATKHAHQGTYWLGFRVFIIVVFVSLYFYATIRRLENAGLSPFLAILAIVPVVGFTFWLALLFIAPKQHKI